jgi:hypothetical protein
MGAVIAAITVVCLIGVLGVAVAPVRSWAVAEIRGYVLILALVNLILANAIVWTIVLFSP